MLFIIKRFPITQQSSKVCHLFFEFFEKSIFILDGFDVDLPLSGVLLFLDFLDASDFFFVLVLNLADLHVDLIDFIEISKLFFLKFFAFEMKGMERVVLLNDQLFQELDSCMLQLDILSQRGNFFISFG